MTNGLTDEAIAAYGAELLDLEAEIEVKQGDKRAIYANLREAYGKRAADSLKLAIKRHRMDADKRTEADEIDAEAERFLTIIRKPSAPRGARTREIIEEFDPETGEIKSSTAARKDVPHGKTGTGEKPVPLTQQGFATPGSIGNDAGRPQSATLQSETSVRAVPPHADTVGEKVQVPHSEADSISMPRPRTRFETDMSVPAGTQAPPVETLFPQPETAGLPEAAASGAEPAIVADSDWGIVASALVATIPDDVGNADATIPHPVEGTTPTSTADGDESGGLGRALVVADNVVPIKKRLTFNDPAHAGCLEPERCGGFSNLGLCQKCREATEQGQVA